MTKSKAVLCLFLSLAVSHLARAQEYEAVNERKIDGLLQMMRKAETGEGAAWRIEWNQRNAVKAIGALRTERAARLLIEFLEDKTLNDWARHEAALVFRKWKVEKGRN